MTEPDPLDDRLARLRAGSIPPPAGAAEARTRGERRRHRQQATLVILAVLAAVSIGGTAALLGSDGGPDALRTADAPTPDGSACAEPSAPGFVTSSGACTPPGCEELLGVPPGTEGDVVVYGDAYGSALECEFDDRPATPQATPSAGDIGPVEWTADAGFLSPESAAAAELPGWSVVQPYEPRPDLLLDPCPDRDLRLSEGQIHSLERAMTSTREAGGSELVQEVTRYIDEGVAVIAVQEIVDELAACPSQPEAGGHEVRLELVERAVSDRSQTLLVRRQPCGPGGACTAHFASYLLVAQVGDGVTVVDYRLAEDGDRPDLARSLLDAVAAQLVRAVRG